jgi:hypothetical protein
LEYLSTVTQRFHWLQKAKKALALPTASIDKQIILHQDGACQILGVEAMLGVLVQA